MKVCFWTDMDILGSVENGGIKLSRQLFECLIEIYGKQNIYLCQVSEEQSIVENSQIKCVYEKNNSFKKNINYLNLRNGFSKETEKIILEYFNYVDADIYFMNGTCSGKFAKKLKERGKKIVAFYHNIEKCLAWNRVMVDKGIIGMPRFVSNWINERYISKYADAHVCLNERDALLLKDNYKKEVDVIMPIIIKDSYKEKEFLPDSYSNTLLFVGSYFYPNIKGLKWFCDNVMTKIPYRLVVIGNGMEKLRNEICYNNIDIIGTVENVDRYYENADAVVIPIFDGGGMKVKTAEALMYGKVIFSTKEGLEGYKYNNENDIYECNEPDEFIISINRFYENFKKTSDINRRLYINNYSPEVFKTVIEDFLEELN